MCLEDIEGESRLDGAVWRGGPPADALPLEQISPVFRPAATGPSTNRRATAPPAEDASSAGGVAFRTSCGRRDLTVGGGQAQDGVWVSYGGNGGGSYMDPEAARVLERYMNEGLCTPGWMIFVDGAQVC